jgi:hypothetical protein
MRLHGRAGDCAGICRQRTFSCSIAQQSNKLAMTHFSSSCLNVNQQRYMKNIPACTTCQTLCTKIHAYIAEDPFAIIKAVCLLGSKQSLLDYFQVGIRRVLNLLGTHYLGYYIYFYASPLMMDYRPCLSQLKLWYAFISFTNILVDCMH